MHNALRPALTIDLPQMFQEEIIGKGQMAKF